MSPRAQRLTLGTLGGVLLGFISVTGGAWALSTYAAERVMGPHLAAAKERVAIMCLWVKNQNEAMDAVCRATNAACPEKIQPDVLMEHCRE